MSVRIYSASIHGIDAQPIEVEVDSSPGLHAFNIVGLPDNAVKESKDRIASAIKNSGLKAPNSKNKKIVINLAPADIKKEGPSYDLPIAIGYLFETGQIKFDPAGRLFAGELSLDGSLKHTNGILAIALMAKTLGFNELIIPSANAKEAAIVSGINVFGARNMKDVFGHLDGTAKLSPTPFPHALLESVHNESAFMFIKGQETAKRALSVAAAGAHNILMNGAPGSGKTILAQALGELLPPMVLDEAIEVAKIYSSVGLIKDAPLSFKRPFRNPHHTTSAVAVVGGGTWPRPGEISLAHRGVLFLDELPEFPRNVLESLRQPLEDGIVSISRASGSVTLPAKFTLVAAMNPCPCGNYGDDAVMCVCPASAVMRYRKKVSGPLLDRMDIQVNVPRETIKESPTTGNAKEVAQIKENIRIAREIQRERFKGSATVTNSEINYKTIDRFCVMEPGAENLLKQAVNAKRLSLRAYHKIKKLARTVADLEQSERIGEHHVAEAVSLRINESLFSDLV